MVHKKPTYDILSERRKHRICRNLFPLDRKRCLIKGIFDAWTLETRTTVYNSLYP
jgi:hypothetical protein